MSDQFQMLFNKPTNSNSETLLTEIKSLLTECSSKVDRLTLEVISIRNEFSAIKTKVYGRCNENDIEILQKPSTMMEDFLKLEKSLEDEKVFKKLKQEQHLSCEKSYDKFIRASWKRIFTDEVAQKCSWRGTAAKKCIRGSAVTLAIRSVFQQKFALEDSDFDKTSQKHFQYAHDRVLKKCNQAKQTKVTAAEKSST